MPYELATNGIKVRIHTTHYIHIARLAQKIFYGFFRPFISDSRHRLEAGFLGQRALVFIEGSEAVGFEQLCGRDMQHV